VLGAVLLIVLAIAGCVLRWGGREVFGVDPDADVRIIHPHAGPTNSIPVP
jgi:hypothetical protein